MHCSSFLFTSLGELQFLEQELFKAWKGRGRKGQLTSLDAITVELE